MTDDNYICPICSKEFDKFFNRYQADNGQVACSFECYGKLKQKLSVDKYGFTDEEIGCGYVMNGQIHCDCDDCNGGLKKCPKTRKFMCPDEVGA